jgi:hypothetical protein
MSNEKCVRCYAPSSVTISHVWGLHISLPKQQGPLTQDVSQEFDFTRKR